MGHSRSASATGAPASPLSTGQTLPNACYQDVVAPKGLFINREMLKSRWPSFLFQLVSRSQQREAESKKHVKEVMANNNGLILPFETFLPDPDADQNIARSDSAFLRYTPTPKRVSVEGEYLNLANGPDQQRSMSGPDHVYGYSKEAFSGSMIIGLANAIDPDRQNTNLTSPTETYVEPLYLPFLVVESTRDTMAGGLFRSARPDTSKTLQQAVSRCASDGALCTQGMLTLHEGGSDQASSSKTTIAFSCAIDSLNKAVVHFHWIDKTQNNHMLEIGSFGRNDDGLSGFHALMQEIMDWGINIRLPKIKAALDKRRKDTLTLTTPGTSLQVSVGNDTPAAIHPSTVPSDEGKEALAKAVQEMKDHMADVEKRLLAEFDQLKWTIIECLIPPSATTGNGTFEDDHPRMNGLQPKRVEELVAEAQDNDANEKLIYWESRS